MHLAGLAMLVALNGCGGSGSSSLKQTATPQISVDWPNRSRAFTGVSSAQSVVVTIHQGLASGADLTFSANRNAAPDAHTGTYPSTQPITVGPHQIDVKFFADAGAGGAQVGSASVAASVQADGTVVRADGSPLGDIQTSATVSTVALVAGQTVEAGTTKQLTFTAQDAASSLVAVSAGSAFFAVSAGATKLDVSPSGVANDLALGVATVVVTVDSIASTPGVVTVTTPAPTVRSFDANTYQIAYDSSRNLIYGTVPAHDPEHANSLVAYDPATGAITKSLSLPTEPYEIAISDDFQFAYVSQSADGRIANVDLSSFTLRQSFRLSAVSTDTVFRMQVRPGHPSQVAVSHLVGGGSESKLTIYNNGVAEPKIDHSVHQVAFGGQDKLYGGHFGNMTSYAVDDTGVTETLHNDNAPGYSYAFLAYANGRLYENQFGVLDGASMNILGTYPGRLNSSLVVPDQTSGYAYGLTWGLPTSRTFKVFRKSDFGLQTSLDIPDAGNSTSAFVQISPTSFAFNVAGPSKIYVIENVYLP